MKKYVCPLCGYIYESEDDNPPLICPVCGATSDQFLIIGKPITEESSPSSSR